MSITDYTEKFGSHPQDVRRYDTAQLRDAFLIESMFEAGRVKLTYTGYDRFIVGGVMPTSEAIALEPIPPMKASYFCERREVGIVNLGGKSVVGVDGVAYDLDSREAIYIGQGSREIVLESKDRQRPAVLYLNSAPAHKAHQTRLIKKTDTKVLELGEEKNANRRRIIQFITASTCETCQLQMGMTELQEGSVWNTMPPHTHTRRMEVYLYTDLPHDQAICHFMGEASETRHIWMRNNQAVISPNWSIHSAAGTSNYSFIWGMAGENLDFSDMDVIQPTELR